MSVHATSDSISLENEHYLEGVDPHSRDQTAEIWQPISGRLPSFDGETITWVNRIVNKLGPISLPPENETWDIAGFRRFELLPIIERKPPPISGVHFALQSAGLVPPITLTLKSVQFSDLLYPTDRKIIDLDIQKMPDDIKGAVIDAIFGDALDNFERWSGMRFDINLLPGLAPERPNDCYYMSFRSSFGPDSRTIDGYLSLKKTHIEQLCKIFDGVAFPEPALNIEELPLNVRFILGKTRLAVKDLQTLGCLDIVLIDEIAQTNYPRNPAKSFLFNNAHFYGVKKGHKIVVTKIGDFSMENECADLNLSKIENDELDVGDINADILFELGRKQVTLKELKTIRPGYVFDTADANNAVSVVVNGKTIGYGELVTLGSRIGVRLLQFSIS